MPEKESVEHAVALAMLTQQVAALTAAQARSDAKIQDLLDAFNASRWVIRSIAAIAGIAASIAVVIGAYRGLTK